MCGKLICHAVRTSIGRYGSARSAISAICDITIGRRFVNPTLKAAFGVDSMPETADNVAEDFGVSRADQDAFAAPASAARKVLERAGLSIGQMDVIVLNAVFASQALAMLRNLGVADDAPHVNPNGGAIAIGRLLGMSGAAGGDSRLSASPPGGRYALCIGQGIATILGRV
jgi:acetyl-CoA acetyltransferase